MMTVQVSSAEVIWPTRAFSAGSRPARSAERASTGTIALVSAPPRISSYSRSGTWFAVTYAVPRQPAPTVCENTSVRTRPRIRDRIGQAGDDGGTAGDARTEPPRRARTRRLGLDHAALSPACTCNSRSSCMRGLRPVTLLSAGRTRIQPETESPIGKRAVLSQVYTVLVIGLRSHRKIRFIGATPVVRTGEWRQVNARV